MWISPLSKTVYHQPQRVRIFRTFRISIFRGFRFFWATFCYKSWRRGWILWVRRKIMRIFSLFNKTYKIYMKSMWSRAGPKWQTKNGARWSFSPSWKVTSSTTSSLRTNRNTTSLQMCESRWSVLWEGKFKRSILRLLMRRWVYFCKIRVCWRSGKSMWRFVYRRRKRNSKRKRKLNWRSWSIRRRRLLRSKSNSLRRKKSPL